jgi:hypothetical protein
VSLSVRGLDGLWVAGLMKNKTEQNISLNSGNYILPAMQARSGFTHGPNHKN